MLRIMIDAHNRILCYGNPAGYVRGGRAVIDPMFKTAEMDAFLAGQSFETVWQDGMYDRLVLGQEQSDGESAAPLKHCRIWQLRADTPVEMRFISLDAVKKGFGEPTSDRYAPVYDGEMDSNDLEAIYEKLNTGVHPPGYAGHSLSISDVVELYDECGSEFYYCDRVGFRQIPFSRSEQGISMEQSL